MMLKQSGRFRQPVREAIAPPDPEVPERIRELLRDEEVNDFESYDTVPKLFDCTYDEVVTPFLKTLP
jgi:hypothetical protein